ncbi:MAG: Holliday junction branch migration protein RuvA [Paracoccaceae bacterium]
MIGRISGILDYVSADHILVDVGGVGYIVYVTQSTISNLPNLGDIISLFTELVVKEDLLQLVGFITPVEREWYKLLTSVQGVGSKAALALLGQIPIQNISRAILLEDFTTITSAQGIGPKIAKRIVVELKGKVPNMIKFENKSGISLKNGTKELIKKNYEITDQNFSQNNVSQKEIDAISALMNLGYSQLNSSQVIAKIIDASNEELDVEDIIRLSLKTLVSKG